MSSFRVPVILFIGGLIDFGVAELASKQLGFRN
jgi:hypothetical protein